MEEILSLIEQYTQIILFRHINPDLDAFGSQIGMYYILKENFKNKKIIVAGDRSSDLYKMFVDFDIEEYADANEEALGITLDTANKSRIDGDYEVCNKLIKIDHHIEVDPYGDVNIVNDDASSCSEIVVDLCRALNLSINKEASECLFRGIVGDTNRFRYNKTSANTFKDAAFLMDKGIDIQKIYEAIYLRSLKSLRVESFIMSHYVVDGRIAYYILYDKDLKALDIKRSQGSDFVTLLGDVEDFDVWMAITENKEENNYRVSIRSRAVAINEVANMFRGGGHANASGATLSSLDELDYLINKLKERINEEDMGDI